MIDFGFPLSITIIHNCFLLSYKNDWDITWVAKAIYPITSKYTEFFIINNAGISKKNLVLDSRTLSKPVWSL